MVDVICSIKLDEIDLRLSDREEVDLHCSLLNKNSSRRIITDIDGTYIY